CPDRRQRWLWERRGALNPDQHGAVLIDGKLSSLDDFCLQILEIRIVEPKLPLERPICNPLMTLEEFEYCIEHRVEVHAQALATSRIARPWAVVVWREVSPAKLANALRVPPRGPRRPGRDLRQPAVPVRPLVVPVRPPDSSAAFVRLRDRINAAFPLR